MDCDPLHRTDAIGTLSTAVEWLGEVPLLAGVFLVASLVDALGDVSVAFSLLGSVLLVFARGVAHRSAERLAAGSTPDLAPTAARVADRLLSLLVVWILTVALVVAGLFFLILPGIYLALRLSLAGPACVVDDLGAIDSLSRSWSVAAGNLRKVLGIGHAAVAAVLVVFLPVTVLGGPVAGGAGLPSGVVGGLLGAVVAAVVAPVVELAIARVYLENRPTDASADAEEPPDAGVDDSFDPDARFGSD